MKKFITVCFVLAIGYTSNAQVNVEFGPSFNSPSGDFADTYNVGAGFSIEPRIKVMDKLEAGLYLAAIAFAGGDISGGSGLSTSVDAAAVTPVVLTGTYRFVDSKVAPYAGAGLGMYFSRTAGVDISGSNVDDVTNSDFGFMGRAGVFIGRMNLGVSYHSAGDISFMQFGLGVRIGPR